MKHLFFMIITGFVLTACGPVLRDDTVYTPPTDPSQLKAINACQNAFNDCTNGAMQLMQSCRANNQDRNYYNYQYCKDAAGKSEDYCRMLWLSQLVPPACPNAQIQMSNCKNTFHDCYRMNGGQVQERVCCVSNCAESPVPLCYHN